MTTTANTVLCFDIGLKRTGVASGNTLTKSANPAGQLLLNNGRFDWASLDKLIAEWGPSHLVIGDPFTKDAEFNNADTPQSSLNLKKVINRFKSHIQQNHKLTIIEFDERLTSAAASDELHDRDLNMAKKTLLRDQVAACLILESYFNSISD